HVALAVPAPCSRRTPCPTQCPRCGCARSCAGVAQRGASTASHPRSLTRKPHHGNSLPPSVLHTLGRAPAQPENAQTTIMPSTAPLLPRKTTPDSDLPLLVAAVPAARRKLRVIFTCYEGQGHDPSRIRERSCANACNPRAGPRARSASPSERQSHPQRSRRNALPPSSSSSSPPQRTRGRQYTRERPSSTTRRARRRPA
ncbi:hypothetical protein B0H13DRAFT_2559953, partial [Mycena leptocephala]